MSLENIQGKMSRMEMKNIMAGSGGSVGYCNITCISDYECSGYACPSCRPLPNWSGAKYCV